MGPAVILLCFVAFCSGTTENSVSLKKWENLLSVLSDSTQDKDNRHDYFYLFPDEVTCESEGRKYCSRKERICKNKRNETGYECKECPENYVYDDDTYSCKNASCENEGKHMCHFSRTICENKPNGGPGYHCKDCPKNYRYRAFICEKVTCENEGTTKCSQSSKICLNNRNGEGGYQCKKCPKNKFDWRTKTCEEETCEYMGRIICANDKRICIDKEDGGFNCKDCPELYAFDEETGGCEKVMCGRHLCVNGKCEDKSNKTANTEEYKCSCFDGYTGVRCDEKTTYNLDKKMVWIIVFLLSAVVILQLFTTCCYMIKRRR